MYYYDHMQKFMAIVYKVIDIVMYILGSIFIIWWIFPVEYNILFSITVIFVWLLCIPYIRHYISSRYPQITWVHYIFICIWIFIFWSIVSGIGGPHTIQNSNIQTWSTQTWGTIINTEEQAIVDNVKQKYTPILSSKININDMSQYLKNEWFSLDNTWLEVREYAISRWINLSSTWSHDDNTMLLFNKMIDWVWFYIFTRLWLDKKVYYEIQKIDFKKEEENLQRYYRKKTQDKINAVKAEQEKIEKCLSPRDWSNDSFVRQVKSYMNDPNSFEHVVTHIKKDFANGDTKVKLHMQFRWKNWFWWVITNVYQWSLDIDSCDVTDIS